MRYYDGVILVCIVLLYAYEFVVQPWLCWKLWPTWYLRPLVVYMASTYLALVPLVLCLPFTFAASCFTTTGETVDDKTLARVASIETRIVRAFGRLVFGYELYGIEHLPHRNQSGALIVYYHGLNVMDQFLFVSEVYLLTGRLVGGIVDRFLLQIPVIKTHLKMFDFSADREGLVRDLKLGKMRTVSPGGVYEAMFSKNYSIEWRGRTGFATVAKEANVPVIPMFTTNHREQMDMFHLGSFIEVFKHWYLRVRIPFGVVVSSYPVKMKTYLGEPLYCQSDEHPKEFAQRVQRALEGLRDKHQRIPGSTIAALMERFNITC